MIENLIKLLDDTKETTPIISYSSNKQQLEEKIKEVIEPEIKRQIKAGIKSKFTLAFGLKPPYKFSTRNHEDLKCLSKTLKDFGFVNIQVETDIDTIFFDLPEKKLENTPTLGEWLKATSLLNAIFGHATACAHNPKHALYSDPILNVLLKLNEDGTCDVDMSTYTYVDEHLTLDNFYNCKIQDSNNLVEYISKVYFIFDEYNGFLQEKEQIESYMEDLECKFQDACMKLTV